METTYTGVDYDPNNPAHVAQWIAAGRPDLEALDNDGERWRPSVTCILDAEGKMVSEEVKSPPPLPDAARPAKSLDLAATKAVRAAINNATTVGQVKAALLAYFDARIDGR